MQGIQYTVVKGFVLWLAHQEIDDIEYSLQVHQEGLIAAYFEEVRRAARLDAQASIVPVGYPRVVDRRS